MTRLNSNIEPKSLTDQHLIAELREIPRIVSAVRKRLDDGKLFDDIPLSFKLGSGHVKFFYDKLGYVKDRHDTLRKEYTKRFGKDWNIIINLNSIPNYLTGNYSPSTNDYVLLKDRISSRIISSTQKPYYYRTEVSKDYAVSLLSVA